MGASAKWPRAGPDERRSAYAIIARTEWNFHPGGRSSPRSAGRRAATARRLASLVEPCVVFEVVLKEPAGA
jgi:hypothetical protein